MVAKYFERIGDLAKRVAAWGDLPRHRRARGGGEGEPAAPHRGVAGQRHENDGMGTGEERWSTTSRTTRTFASSRSTRSARGGIEARGCADDAEFRRACAERTPDAVLLDIMLPDADGLEILARLRRTPGLKNVPVMMLTAKDTELDTVRAPRRRRRRLPLQALWHDGGREPHARPASPRRARGCGGREAHRADVRGRDALARPARGQRGRSRECSSRCASSICWSSSCAPRAWSSRARRCSSASGAGTSTGARARLTCTCSRSAPSSAKPPT